MSASLVGSEMCIRDRLERVDGASEEAANARHLMPDTDLGSLIPPKQCSARRFSEPIGAVRRF
eukprot:5091424-Alexandrium_andersonii.AAC.1